jgi:hypothetical protein
MNVAETARGSVRPGVAGGGIHARRGVNPAESQGSRTGARERARAFDRLRDGRRVDPSCRWSSTFLYRNLRWDTSVQRVRTMSAATSWFVSVMAILGLVLALHHLGLDVTIGLGMFVHGAEHVLGQPLFLL